MNLRNDYRACLKLADETDSKKEDKILRDEAAKLLVQLRTECKHEHVVILRSDYDGSYSSYDEPEYGHRICLCCGVEEYGYKYYKVLTLKPIARFEQNAPDSIKRPLTSLLSDLVDLAMSKGYPVFDRS